VNKKANKYDLVVGLGEIGRPLKNLLAEVYPVIGRDVDNIEINEEIRVLHICYPYQVSNFVGTTIDYINQYQPELTIVNSTIVPGTMRKIYESVGGMLAYSPMRGKHTRMRKDLMYYTKFIAGATPEACDMGADYLSKADFNIKKVSKLESLELAKIVETTYFGLLIAWAQEIERISNSLDVEYEDALLLTDEVNYLPPVIFQPGYIGGHCIMPNIKLLENVYKSPFLDIIKESNEKKKLEWLEQGRDLDERIAPKKNQN